MSSYADAVEHGLRGLEAVSTGLNPGCDECRSSWSDYQPRECERDGGDTLGWEVWAVKGSWYETEEAAETAAREAFEEAWSTQGVPDEGHFSWRPCGICGTTLGGTRESWHGVDRVTGRSYHFDDACTDCVVYLANGDEPEGARGE